MVQFCIVTFVLALFIFYIRLNKKDILLPENLFSIIILATYAVACLGLSRLQHAYPLWFTFLMIGMVLVFQFGAKIHFKKEDIKFRPYTYSKRRFKQSVYILFLIVFISFCAMWYLLGAPPLLSKADRATYFVPGFGTLYLMINVLSFFIMYDLLDKHYLKKKSYILLLIILIMLVLMSNKFQLIYFLCQYLVLYNIMKKRIKLSSLIKLGVLALLIFIIYYAYVYKGMYISNEEMFQVNQMKLPSHLSMLTNPYMYTAFNYENLYHYITLDQTTFGSGFYILANWMDVLGIQEFITGNASLLSNQWQMNLQYGWLTTGTFFRECYMDFGMIGMLLFTLFTGFICKLSYKRCYQTRSLFHIYFYVSNMICIFLVFFTNYFITVNYLLNLICAFVISKYCFHKEGKGEAVHNMKEVSV